MTKDCAKVAVQIHKNMVNDNGFGYSWEERWGYAGDKVTYTINDEKFVINRGDYDCSSSTITAWKTAISKTKYAGKLDAATYTGNMRSVFVGSGLFEWKPISFIASPGDLYLNETNHVAMCQTQEPDILSEFSGNEYGGAYGGKRGDQTGNEAHLGNYYDYPWDGILHYNDKANSTEAVILKEETKTSPVTKLVQPRYCVYIADEWLDEMDGLVDKTSNDDYAGIAGRNILYLALANAGKYRVYTKQNGWLDYVTKFDLNDEENGMAGDGSSILALQIPNGKIKYQVHAAGQWFDWMIGNKDTGGSGDAFAGDKQHPIDMVRICLA